MGITRAYAVSAGDSVMGHVLQKARTWDEGAEDGFEATPTDTIFGGKKVAVFALPGAATGVCTKAHVPSWTENAAAIKSKGVDEIICLSVNDPFVLKAWAKVVDPDNKLSFYADADASLTKALGMDVDLSVAALGTRSTRYSMLVEDGTVSAVNVEETPGDMEVSGGSTMLSQL